MDATLYYKHSGQFTVGGVLSGALVGLAAAVLAGAIYACAVLYIPLVYLNVLLCIAYGLAVGFIPTYVMRQLRVRNVSLILGIGLVLAAVSFYVAWGIWVWMHMRQAEIAVPLLNVLGRPGGLWRMIQLINESGTWSLGRSGASVKGPVLAAIWIAEAGVFFYCVFWAIRGQLFTPFCEACQTWCREGKAVGLLAIGDPRELRRHLEAKDFAYLEEVGLPQGDPKAWVQLDLYSCPRCDDMTTLCASRCTVTSEKKGKKSISRSPVVTHLLLNAADKATLKNVCGRMLQSALDAAAAVQAVLPTPPAPSTTAAEPAGGSQDSPS